MLAFTKKEAIPSPTPCCCLNASLRRSRSAIIALMSISLNVVSIAALCCASTSRRAMVARRFDIRCRSSRRSPVRAALAAAGFREGPGCATGAGAGAGFAAGTMAFSTSCFITRPAAPDPWIDARLTSWSSAILRAVGVARDVEAGWAGDAGGADWVGGAGCDAFEPLPDGVTAGAGADSSTTASSSPIFTSSPSLCLMLAMTPPRSALTSRSIFSVSSSTTGSPTSTRSPSFFSHRATRASTTDSPSCGTTMLVMVSRSQTSFDRTIEGSGAELPRSNACSTSIFWFNWCHAADPSDGLELRARPM